MFMKPRTYLLSESAGHDVFFECHDPSVCLSQFLKQRMIQRFYKSYIDQRCLDSLFFSGVRSHGEPFYHTAHGQKRNVFAPLQHFGFSVNDRLPVVL